MSGSSYRTILRSASITGGQLDTDLVGTDRGRLDGVDRPDRQHEDKFITDLRMRKNLQFDNAIVLGTSLAGKFSALALGRMIKVDCMVGPQIKNTDESDLVRLTGKIAQSHIFLPRMKRDLEISIPSLISDMKDQGLEFVRGARCFSHRAPLAAQRMFACRWELENAVNNYASKRLGMPAYDLRVSAIKKEAKSNKIVSVEFADSDKGLPVGPRTLVVDCLGAQSPLMQTFIEEYRGIDGLVNTPTHVGYATQWFCLNSGVDKEMLPDPILRCCAHLEDAFVTVYPGVSRYFTVTAIYDARVGWLRTRFSSKDNLISYFKRNKWVSRWIDNAEPIGSPKPFLNPRNRWNVPILNEGSIPPNYIAVGDSLVTSAPTLGAGCSFMATHVRLLCEALEHEDFHRYYCEGVESEQFELFQYSVGANPPKFQDHHQLRKGFGAITKNFVKRLINYHWFLERQNIIKSSTL